MVEFEGKEKRMPAINEALKKYGFKNLEEAQELEIDGQIREIPPLNALLIER